MNRISCGPHSRRIGFRAIVLALTLSLAGCGNDRQTTPIPGGPPSRSAASPPQADFLASKQVIDVPAGHREAAAALVAQALEARTRVPAVREILTRAGVRIINARGMTVNAPAAPSKIGFAVYDFQVPMLADSLRAGSTVRLARVADLAPQLYGIELPEAVLAEALRSWMIAAPAQSGNPEAFDAALLQELAKVLPKTRAAGRIDLLSFLVLGADIYGRKGTLRRPSSLSSALGDALGIRAAHAATPCPAEAYDAWEDLPLKTGKTITDWIIEILGDEWSTVKDAWKAGKDVNKAVDVFDILDSTLARIALVAGLRIEVSGDAAGKELHLRHSSGGSDMQPARFTATVRFETPWPGATVQCGPLKGYTIPDNSTVGGVWVEWALGDRLETLENQSSGQLRRGGGGGGPTDADGKAELRAEAVPEAFCPNDRGWPVDKSKCGKGKLKRASSRVEAELDLTRTPPIKIKDLLMGPNPTWATGKALVKVLTDVATDIATSARSASTTVSVAWHDGGVYVWAGTVTIAFERATADHRTTFNRADLNAKNVTTDVSQSSRTTNLIEAVLPPATPTLEGESKPIARVLHRYTHRDEYFRKQTLTLLCRSQGRNPQWRETSASDSSVTDEAGEATQSLPVVVTVSPGRAEYTISVHYPALTTQWREERTNAPAGGCANPTPSSKTKEGKTSALSEAYAQSGTAIIHGTFDPKNPDTLSGENIVGELAHGRFTQKWNLRRVQPAD